MKPAIFRNRIEFSHSLNTHARQSARASTRAKLYAAMVILFSEPSFDHIIAANRPLDNSFSYTTIKIYGLA
jgi:hypothetical protein